MAHQKKGIGLVPALVAAFVPLILLLATHEPAPSKAYTVGMDSGEPYAGEKVKLSVTKAPYCGTDAWNRKGIKGSGVLEIEKEGIPFPVMVEPCITHGQAVELPDGRVLQLTETKG